jgi:hypothetical protein
VSSPVSELTPDASFFAIAGAALLLRAAAQGRSRRGLLAQGFGLRRSAGCGIKFDTGWGRSRGGGASDSRRIRYSAPDFCGPKVVSTIRLRLGTWYASHTAPSGISPTGRLWFGLMEVATQTRRALYRSASAGHLESLGTLRSKPRRRRQAAVERRMGCHCVSAMRARCSRSSYRLGGEAFQSGGMQGLGCISARAAIRSRLRYQCEGSTIVGTSKSSVGCLSPIEGLYVEDAGRRHAEHSFLVSGATSLSASAFEPVNARWVFIR